MAPSNPKRPPRPRQGSGTPPEPKRERRDVSLPFNDEEIEPLRADDPHPQHVPQLPSNPGVRGRVDATSRPVDPSDRELSGPFRASDPVSEPGFAPAFLYVERGPGAGQLVPLRQGVLLIGRASTSGLRMQHPSISRRHAQLTRRGDRFFLRDLGSQNGTFVNQLRIDREVEIVAGDDVVMGTAQLKLRVSGSGRSSGAGTGHSRTSSEVTPRMRRRRASNTTAVALTAGAVGFGLAALAMFGIYKLSRGPSYEELDDRPAEVERAQRPAPATRAAKANATGSDDLSASDERVEESTRADEEPVRAEAAPEPVRSAKPLAEPTRTQPMHAGEVTRSRPEPVRSPKPVAESARTQPAPEPVRTRSAQPVASKPADERTHSSAAESAVLAKYAAGDLSAAINLAKARGAKDLAAKLGEVKEAYDAGQNALASGDQPGAVRSLDHALQLDHQLSRMPGALTIELRRQLSSLYLLQGHSERDPMAAQRAFAKALQYDPNNDAARAELVRLGGAP